MRYCSNCGTQLDPDGRFCGACGFDNGELVQSSPPPAAEKPRRRIPRWIIIVGILILLVCCVLTIGGYTLVRVMEGLDFSELEGLLESEDWFSDSSPQSDDSNTRIYDVWVEHNVEFEGNLYMVFHVDLEIVQIDAADAVVGAFIWLEDGSPMVSYEPDYDLDGQAAVLDMAEVTYSPSTYWEDYQLWIPYYALEAGEGHFATVELLNADTGQIMDSWTTDPFDVLP